MYLQLLLSVRNVNLSKKKKNQNREKFLLFQSTYMIWSSDLCRCLYPVAISRYSTEKLHSWLSKLHKNRLIIIWNKNLKQVQNVFLLKTKQSNIPIHSNCRLFCITQKVNPFQHCFLMPSYMWDSSCEMTHGAGKGITSKFNVFIFKVPFKHAC